MANEEHAVRIQTSLLNGIEKKFLVKEANRLPHWVTSDMMTAVGVFGSMVICAGYILANINLQWIWLASLGFVINWYGDSLDGNIARVRGTQRPLYGYYLDHNIDCICEFLMFVGIGLSGMVNFWLALLCYVVYLQLEVYVAINAHIKDEFRLTYGKVGPTEFRVIMILVNLVLMYLPSTWRAAVDKQYILTFGNTVFSLHMQLFDWIGCGIFLILVVIYLTAFLQDLRYFAKIDPLHK